jgi:hypothetical protein
MLSQPSWHFKGSTKFRIQVFPCAGTAAAFLAFSLQNMRKLKYHPEPNLRRYLSYCLAAFCEEGSVFMSASVSPSQASGLLATVSGWRQPGVSAKPLGSKCSKL